MTDYRLIDREALLEAVMYERDRILLEAQAVAQDEGSISERQAEVFALTREATAVERVLDELRHATKYAASIFDEMAEAIKGESL